MTAVSDYQYWEGYAAGAAKSEVERNELRAQCEQLHADWHRAQERCDVLIRERDAAKSIATAVLHSEARLQTRLDAAQAALREIVAVRERLEGFDDVDEMARIARAALAAAREGS